MPGKTPSWQSPALSPADVDVHGHVSTASARWQVQRQHLKAQLERERQRHAGRAVLAKRAASAAASRTSAAWSIKDVVASQHVVEQAGIASQESQIRLADHQLSQECASAGKEMQVTRNLGRRIAFDARERALDARAAVHGVALWKRGMQRGRQEYILHAKEEAEDRRAALRGFAAAERIEVRHEALNELLRQTLPSGPVGGTNTLGSGGQMEHDSRARWQEHRTRINARGNRMSTFHLEKQEDVLKKVASARYDAWRQKVDVKFAPGTNRLLATL